MLVRKTIYDPVKDKWSTELYDPPAKPYLVLRFFCSTSEPFTGYEEMYVTKDHLFPAELKELEKFPTQTDFRYVPEIDPELVIVTLQMQKIEMKEETVILD